MVEMRLVVMSPHMRSNYSGPTVFMTRLFSRVAKTSSVDVTAVGPEIPDVRSDWVSYIRLGAPDLRRTGGQVIWACKSVYWLLKNRRSYDLVHLHGGYVFNLISAVAPLAIRKPFVVLPLGAGGDLNLDSKSNKVPLVRPIKRFILRRSRAAFALSEDNASELRAWGVPKSHIFHIKNPASDEFFYPPQPHQVRSYDLLFMGKLSAGKRPTLVIEALAELIDNDRLPVTLTMVGPFASDQDEEALRTLVDNLALCEYVNFTGYVDNVSDIMSELSNAVFVLPSSQEGLPGALTEAMAMGFPAVVTDVGSMGDVIRESEGGCVVEPSSIEIAAALRAIWRNEGTWKQLSIAAYSYAKRHFSEIAVAEEYLTGIGLGEVYEG